MKRVHNRTKTTLSTSKQQKIRESITLADTIINFHRHIYERWCAMFRFPLLLACQIND